MKRYLLLLFLLVALTGCSEDAPPDGVVGDDQRKMVLRTIATNVIVPGFASLATEAAELDAAVTALVAAPDASSLESAQQAWVELARHWKRMEFFQQGLLDQDQQDSLIFKLDLAAADHLWRNATIDQSALESALGTSGTIDIAYVERLPARLQGFFAIEDLLFRSDDATALANLTTGHNATKRREMLSALTKSLLQRIERVHTHWTQGGGNFQQEFADQFGTDLGSSLGMLMNDIVYLAEQLKNQKIGRPVGHFSAQVPQPDSVEARWSGQSMAFFIENLNGIERAFTADADGRVGPGIDSLLNYMDATVGDQNLAEAIITQIDEMRTRANALGSIPEAVRANRALVDELYRECLVLLKLLKVDVVTQLGVMITTLEGDGD